jgi:glycosyltransferase involved in cell wall biosynthesis
MHILFITDNFSPEVNAPASRTFEHTREWIKEGHQITVITSAPNFPKGKVYPGYKNKLWSYERMDGITVLRVWTYITANEGFIKRALDFLSFMVSSFLASFFVRKVDIVIGTSPQFFTIISAWAISGTKKIPFVFELRDLWPESIEAVGAMQNSYILNILEKLSFYLYTRADLIVSVTNSFKDNLIARGIKEDKIIVVTNGVDRFNYKPSLKDQSLIDEFNLNNFFIVGYFGTHGMAHSLATILDAALILQENHKNHKIKFLFLGDGAEKNKLINIAKSIKLDNILFLDSVSKDKISKYWSLLDVSIVHLKKTNLFKTVIPSKIFECMGMGIPILLGVQGESETIIKKYSAGVLFEPENSNQLALKILSLIRNENTRKKISSNALLAVSDFDRTVLAHKMLNKIEELAKRS